MGHVAAEVGQERDGRVVVEVVDHAPQHVEVAVGGCGLEERPSLEPAAGEDTGLPQALLGRADERSRSSRTPSAAGAAPSISASSCPWPPPMSTIVGNGVKSYAAATVGQSRADRRVIASLNVAANSGSRSRSPTSTRRARLCRGSPV